MEQGLAMKAIEKTMFSLGDPYLGRVVICGIDETGQFAVQACATKGRSAGSRDRVYKYDHHGKVWTAPLDPAKANDPGTHNTIYTAMNQYKRWDDERFFVVGNGNHTDNITSALPRLVSMTKALREREQEDDSYRTARIAGVTSLVRGRVLTELAAVKKSIYGSGTEWQTFAYSYIPQGIGVCIHTYHANDPEKAFRGEPFPVPLVGDIDALLSTLWATLDQENKVSLAVKFINIATGEFKLRVVNKYTELSV